MEGLDQGTSLISQRAFAHVNRLGQQSGKGGALQAKGIGHCRMGHLTGMHIEASGEVVIIGQRLPPAPVGQGNHVSAWVEVRATAPGMLATQ